MGVEQKCAQDLDRQKTLPSKINPVQMQLDTVFV